MALAASMGRPGSAQIRQLESELQSLIESPGVMANAAPKVHPNPVPDRDKG
jgi:hypothetical protein